MLIKKRVAGIAVVSLLLMSCATVDKVKEGVMERLPKKQPQAQVAEENTESSPVAAPLLSSEEQLVMSIQESLTSLGYTTGPANGRLGAKTEAAIQDFQLDSGLRIDGKPTPELLDRIKAKIASS